MEMAVVYQSPASLPTAAAPAVNLDWCLFDPRIALVDFVPPAVTAYSQTSNARQVAVSVRYSAPPNSSFLQLYTDDEVFKKPSVVAADEDLILIHMTVAVKGMAKVDYPQNLFVYRACADWPWLRELPPPCGWGARAEHTGIVRIGKDFIVANLNTCRDIDEASMKEIEVANLWLYKSATKQWEIKKLDMPKDQDNGLMPFEWQTDRVFSFHGFICWADYHRGVLFCDVFACEPVLSFVRFPGVEMWRGYRDVPAMYRTVSLCRGQLKFVDVDNGKFRSTGSAKKWGEHSKCCSHKSGCSCRIRTWILKVPANIWKEDATLQLPELWALPKYCTSLLPKIEPTFPVISMQEADILHFIVKEGRKFSDKAWVLTVDVKRKFMRPLTLYKNPIEEGSVVDLSNVFLGIPMICSEALKSMKIPSELLIGNYAGSTSNFCA